MMRFFIEMAPYPIHLVLLLLRLRCLFYPNFYEDLPNPVSKWLQSRVHIFAKTVLEPNASFEQVRGSLKNCLE